MNLNPPILEIKRSLICFIPCCIRLRKMLIKTHIWFIFFIKWENFSLRGAVLDFYKFCFPFWGYSRFVIFEDFLKFFVYIFIYKNYSFYDNVMNFGRYLENCFAHLSTKKQNIRSIRKKNILTFIWKFTFWRLTGTGKSGKGRNKF